MTFLRSVTGLKKVILIFTGKKITIDKKYFIVGLHQAQVFVPKSQTPLAAFYRVFCIFLKFHLFFEPRTL